MSKSQIKKSTLLLLAILTFGTLIAPSVNAEGEIEISTCDDLQDIQDDRTADYILVNDIDCSAATSEGGSLYNSGAGFDPIGDNGSRFTGSLNGQGYTISGLTINRPGENYVTIIGYADTGSSITNLSVTNANYTGQDTMGGIASINRGTASNLSFSGTIIGRNAIGGLFSENQGTLTYSSSRGTVTSSGSNYAAGLVSNNPGTITDSYSLANVTGGNRVGGLVGDNSFDSSIIRRSYAAGSVTGTGADKGGLVGRNVTSDIFEGDIIGTITDSFYDSTTTGQSDTGKGTAKTTAQMKTASTFTGWNFDVEGDGTIGIWIMAGYPHLQNEHTTSIDSVESLQLIAVDLTEDYTLTDDIDASDTVNWNGGDGFDPIGGFTTSFTGSFDGDGFTISDMNINRPGENYVGLFGFSSNILSNLVMTDGDITGNTTTGGLAGRNQGTVSNVSFSGSVSGANATGGILGQNIGTLTRASASGTVTCSDTYCGGMVGLNTDTISDSYAMVNVSGTTFVGGLLGYNGMNDALLTRSYSTGTATGNVFSTGGLVGVNEDGELGDAFVTDSFYDSTTSGKSDTGKGTPKTTAEMKAVATFTDTDTVGLTAAWDFADNPNDDASNNNYWEINENYNSGYPYLAWQDLPDTLAPTVRNITSDKANGTYTVGEVIDIDVTFSEIVTSTGNVTITLETGDTDRTCTFTVTNSTTGTCNYAVQSGDTSLDLNVNTIAGTIADASNNNMTNFVPLTNLSSNKAIIIDTESPSGTITSTISVNSTTASSSIIFTVTFDEDVENFTVDDISVSNASISNFALTSANTTWTFSISPISSGTVSVSVPAELLTDQAGNTNSAVSAFSFNYSPPGGSGGISRRNPIQEFETELEECPFLDITNSFAFESITILCKMRVVSGRDEISFEPDSFLTRAEMIKIALLLFDYEIINNDKVLASYTDIEQDAWYKIYLATAIKENIIEGYSDNTLRPNDPITRAEALKVLVFASKKTLENYSTSPFTDVTSDDWFKQVIDYAYATKLVFGRQPTIFAPNEFVTRAEMATIAVRSL